MPRGLPATSPPGPGGGPPSSPTTWPSQMQRLVGQHEGLFMSPSVDCSEDSFLPLSVPHSYLALVCMPSELGRSLPNSIGSSQPGELQLSQRLRSLSPAVPTPSLGLGNRSRPGPLCSLLRDVKIEAMSPLPPPTLPQLASLASNSAS